MIPMATQSVNAAHTAANAHWANEVEEGLSRSGSAHLGCSELMGP